MERERRVRAALDKAPKQATERSGGAVHKVTAKNRAYWELTARDYQAAHHRDLAVRALAWGTFRAPERALKALGSVRAKDVLELGCGGAEWSAALRRKGARVVGLDLSGAQLAHARRNHRRLALVQADAAQLPLAGDAFDIVMCDQGAITFVDPRRSLPEVGRVLREGGRFVFCVSSPMRFACLDDEWMLTTQLRRTATGIQRVEDDEVVEWVLGHGDWFALLRSYGFEVLALHELVAPSDGQTTYPWYAPKKWATRWPAEDLWVTRKIS